MSKQLHIIEGVIVTKLHKVTMSVLHYKNCTATMKKSVKLHDEADGGSNGNTKSICLDIVFHSD